MLMERGIESDTNDIISYSDRDLLLPPRKRLLAGMKRQNLDLNVVIPSSFRYGGSDFEARMNSLVKSHLKNPYSSNEEIVEASRSAAIEASKVALAARAAAKEKAAKAVKAVADAKNALKLAAIVNEETDNQEKYLKKNKMKAIESLHGNENGKTGDDLALKLDQMINRASRILKGSSASDSDSPKTKKLKTDVCNLGTSNGIADDIDSDGFVAEKHIAVVDLNNSSKLKIIYRDTSRFNDSNLSRTIKEEREKTLVKHQLGKDDDARDTDKKKYKIKQKKLPLSICNVKDEESLKEESLKDKCSSSNDDSKSKCVTRSKSFNSVGGASGDNIVQDENAIVWKCKALKVPPAACVK